MSVGSNIVKQTAKTALKGNYLRVFVACLILTFSLIVTANISGLLGIVVGDFIEAILLFILSTLFFYPLALGVLRYVWRILFSVTDSPIAVFYWFSEKRLYFKALKLIFQFAFRIVFWLAVLNIPSLILYVLSKSFIFELFDTAPPLWTANLGYYSLLLRNLSFVLVFFIMLKFYMAPLLFVADDNMDVSEAMFNSSVIARKSSIDFIGLFFGSFGWILLSFLILPLPFTLPLLFSYYAVHIRFTVSEYNRHIENSKLADLGFV